ncbi:MAG TPA: ATP-grasp domain-containing protein [Balneolaceae bacterium]
MEQNHHPALILGEIGLVQSLGEAGVPVYIGTEIRDNPSLFSRYNQKTVCFSDYTSPEFIDELCKFGETLEQKAVIFSDDDHAILNISQHQERIKNYFLFTFPQAEKVKKLLDKQLFCEIIEQYNLPAPKSITLSSVQEMAVKDVSELNFPCIIKPSFKQAWWGTDFDKKVGDYQKAIKCESYDDAVQKYEQIAEVNPHVVIQEFIEGKEDQLYSVNMYVGNEGDLKGYFIAQKLRTYPVQAGEGCYIVTVRDDEMIAMAMTIADKIGLKGLLNIQFKRDRRSGKPVLLEIHARNSVWSYLGTEAGVNLAALYYEDLTGGKRFKIPDYKAGVTFIFLQKDIKAFIQNFRMKQISIGKWIASYFRRFIVAGYRWNDPLPLLMTLYFFIRRRLYVHNVKLFPKSTMP